MKRILFLLIALTIIVGFGFTFEDYTITPSKKLTHACYLCGNIAGKYVKFKLPNDKAKENQCINRFNCDPFNVVKCPENSEQIIGTVKN